MNLNIKLSESRMNCLKREADELGITPNMLARMQLSKLNSPHETEDAERTFIIRMKNWREIKSYMEDRGFSDLDVFINKAVIGYMKKNHLPAALRAAIDKNIKE